MEGFDFMKKIKLRKIVLIALFFSLVLSAICFILDKSLVPPQERIEEMVKYADNIAYLRQGVSEKTLNTVVQDVKVETILDEKSKDKSELHFIVKVQHKDFVGLVQVTYPAKRDSNGALMIGVPYRNTLIYVHTFSEYVLMFILIFVGVFGIMISFAVNIWQRELEMKNKSGKGDA